MAVCPEHPDNLIANWDFSNGFNNWSQSIIQGDGFFMHLSQCGTDKWPNEAAEADYDQVGGGWEVGDEAKIWQDVDASALSGYDHLVLSWAESHHTDLVNPGIQVVTLYGSDNQSDWTQLWQRTRVEEAARGAGKNCEELPQFTYVVPVPVTYDYYRLEFHARVGSTLDGWLFSWVQLYPAGEAQVVPAVGATSTVTEVNGRNNQTVANDSITITEAGGVLLAVLACYDADGVAVGSSVVLDPGGPEEANFSFVAGQHDMFGAATLRVELWQLADPPAGTFTVRGTVTATCHNVVVGAQQYGEIGGIGALVSNTRTLVNDSNAPPAVRLQPQSGSRVVMASIQRLLATYTAPIPGDTIRFQKQSQDGTSVRAVTVALVDTAVEADTCWTGLEVAAAPASIQEWAAIGVELLGVDEAGHSPLVAGVGSYSISGQDASLLAGRQLSLVTGAYQVTGQPLGTRVNRYIALAPATYMATGHDLAIARTKLMVLETGTYALTGRSVGTLAGRTLALDPATFTVVGSALITLWGYHLSATTGEFVASGGDLVPTAHRRATLTTGIYVIMGSGAGLAASRRLMVGPGTYVIVGSVVDLDYSGEPATYTIILAAGSYPLVGQPLPLLVGRRLAMLSGTCLVDGQPVNQLVNRYLPLWSGAYQVDGQSVGTRFGRYMAPRSGGYAVTGQSVALLLARYLGLVPGQYTIMGTDLGLDYSGEVIAIVHLGLRRRSLVLRSGSTDHSLTTRSANRNLSI